MEHRHKPIFFTLPTIGFNNMILSFNITINQIYKRLWELHRQMSSGYTSWHDLEVAQKEKNELEMLLKEIINSPKPMKKTYPAKKKKVLAKKGKKVVKKKK